MPPVQSSGMACLDDIAAILTQIEEHERALAALRAASPSLGEQLAQACAEVEAAARPFRAQPWTTRAGMLGASAALLPEATLAFAEGEARRRAAADPRETFDAATRTKRTAAAEGKIADLAATIDHDDLRTLRRAAAKAHAAYRGLAARRDEIRLSTPAGVARKIRRGKAS
jgi:hypothetical protein